MAKLLETLKFNLTQEELDSGPAIFVLLEEPLEFAKRVIEAVSKIKDVSVGGYRAKQFLDYFQQIETEGLRKISEDRGISLEMAITNSKVDSANLKFRIKRTSLDIFFGRRVPYSFNIRNVSVSQIIGKIVEKIEKYVERIKTVETDEEYRDFHRDLKDEDYAYDLDLLKFATKNIELDYDDDSFSNHRTNLYVGLTNSWSPITALLSKDSYSGFNGVNHFLATINDLNLVIDNIEKHCAEKNIAIDGPHPDGPSPLRFWKSYTPIEETVADNKENLKRYRERYLNQKVYDRAIANELKFLKKIFGDE
jgi:hypothetical protein